MVSFLLLACVFLSANSYLYSYSLTHLCIASRHLNMSTPATQGSHNQDRWYFTKEQLENSPSRKCGYDAEKELSCRQQAANLIQDMGQRLQVTQLCINTAIVYMHRFYVFHSFTQFHRNSIATASLFLAAKVEEQPRKLEHVIRVSQLCLFKNQPPLDPRSDAYQEQAQEIVVNENVLLQTLGFDVGIEHPHTYVVRCCHLVRASKDLTQTSYFMASNSLHLTTMCLQYRSTVVACFCIHLACKWANWEIPQSNEGRKWFWYIDKEVTQEQLEQLTEEFLAIFDKCPSKLKKRICSISSNQNSTLMAAFDGDSKKMGSFSNATFAPPHSTSGKVVTEHTSNGPPPEYRKMMAGSSSRSSTSSAIPAAISSSKPTAHVFPQTSSSSRPPTLGPTHHSTSTHPPKIKTEHPPKIKTEHPPIKSEHPAIKSEPVTHMKQPLLIKQEPIVNPEPLIKQEPYTRPESYGQQPPIRKHEPPNPSRAMTSKPSTKPVISNEVRKNGHDLPVPKTHPSAAFISTSAPKLPPPSHADVITNVIKEVTYSKQMEKSILNHKEPSSQPQLSMSISQTKAPSIFSPEKTTSPVINKTPFKIKSPPSFSPIKISPSKSSEGLKVKLEPELVPMITKLGDEILSKPKIFASEIVSEGHESHAAHSKKKKKHKEKDKDRDKKHKEKKKHKDDKHHKEKRKDKHRDREPSHMDPAPIKITIPKDKIIEMPCSSNIKKIKIKDTNENPLKLRISKDFLSKDSRKRDRDTDDGDYPSSKRIAS